MNLPMHRRRFLGATASAFAALAASGCSMRWPTSRVVTASRGEEIGYGGLVPDPAGLVDLPQGFSYRTISQLGDAMSDGFSVPDAADGMGCFSLSDGKITLVRNHELMPGQNGGGVAGRAYDTVARSLVPLPGGTTTIVLDPATLSVERQYRSLAGTIGNHGGGPTPWGSWLSCEQSVLAADGRINKDHGWVFEVPAAAPGLVDPVPLKAMGRFSHAAACVDPHTGVVYMTEDRPDGLLYRFVPKSRGNLAKGGQLQALALDDGLRDSRNWGGVSFPIYSGHAVRWIDLDEAEAPADDLRQRGAAAGACLFARGAGIHMGDGELYFCCTNGGIEKLGQIFRLDLGRDEKIDLFFESTSPDQFNHGDNLTIAPWGDLIACENHQPGQVDNYLRGIASSGTPYPLARLHASTAWAGACFSPHGRTLFVNVSSPAKTIAITGPWI